MSFAPFQDVVWLWHAWQFIHYFLTLWCNMCSRNRSPCVPKTSHGRGTRLRTFVIQRADCGMYCIPSSNRVSMRGITRRHLVQSKALLSQLSLWVVTLLQGPLGNPRSGKIQPFGPAIINTHVALPNRSRSVGNRSCSLGNRPRFLVNRSQFHPISRVFIGMVGMLSSHAKLDYQIDFDNWRQRCYVCLFNYMEGHRMGYGIQNAFYFSSWCSTLKSWYCSASAKRVSIF